MAPEEKMNSGTKGFASMDKDKKKQIASMGGKASAQGKKTANRGFASMDREKQRAISSQGGKASQTTKNSRLERSEADAESGITGDKDASERDLSSLEDEDSLEPTRESQGSLAYSETDEDEDEGLGDGNLGRSTRSGGLGK